MSAAVAAKRITLDVSGETFAALELGDSGARAVLCLHGFPDSPASFVPLAIELESAGYRIVIPWLRGYAPSPLGGPFHVDQLADDLIGLARAVSADDTCAVVGHDWGAVALFAALARRPAAIRAACALAVPHPLALVTNAMRSLAQLRRSSYMAALALPGGERRFARDEFAMARTLWRRWSPGFELGADDWRDLRETLAASHPAPMLYYRANSWPLAGATSRARRLGSLRIAAPVLNLFGADDGCITAAMTAGQDRYFSGSHTVAVVPAVGHFLHLEQPVRVAAEIIAHFERATV